MGLRSWPCQDFEWCQAPRICPSPQYRKSSARPPPHLYPPAHFLSVRFDSACSSFYILGIQWPSLLTEVNCNPQKNRSGDGDLYISSTIMPEKSSMFGLFLNFCVQTCQKFPYSCHFHHPKKPTDMISKSAPSLPQGPWYILVQSYPAIQPPCRHQLKE